MVGTLSKSEMADIIDLINALSRYESDAEIAIAGPIPLITVGNADPVGELDNVDGDWQFRA